VKYDVEPEEFVGEYGVKARRYGAGRRAALQYRDDEVGQYGDDHSHYGNHGWNGEVGNSFRRRARGRDSTNIVSELLAQMQHTAALLERFVVAASANRRSTPARRRPTPKNADEDASVPLTPTEEKPARQVNSDGH